MAEAAPEEQKERLILLGRIAKVFSPSAPIDRYDLFAGRSEQVLEVLNAINQRGQHVVLFGERGVGKTSLTNVLAELSDHMGIGKVQAIRINCDRSDDYKSLWEKVFKRLQFGFEGRPSVGFTGETTKQSVSLIDLLPEDPSPEDVRMLLESYVGNAIVIIDEFDRISGSNTTGLVADTIKSLSDHSAASTMILVGVADSVDDLIGEHDSVERALVQVRMPRMSDPELREVIGKGLSAVDMSVEDAAAAEIVGLSQGLPHYTHLLSLHSAQTAVRKGRRRVLVADVEEALSKAVNKAQQSIASKYHAATASPRKDSLFEEVLLACALAETDDLGFFAAADVRAPLSRIMGKPYSIPAFSRHLDEFSSDRRGDVLKKVGQPRRWRYRFTNPMMQPYVLMKGRAEGTLDNELLPTDADQLNLEIPREQ